jgi:hypothetical protein
MIQRIQTVYLFLVVVLGTLLCFFPSMQFQIDAVDTLVNLSVFDKWPIAVMTIASPVLAFVTIFLFKHRLLQSRINIMNVIICLGYYAILALYTAYIVKGHETIDSYDNLLGAAWYPTVWASIPLVNLILLMMATRRILKDEALVRAADRLR